MSDMHALLNRTFLTSFKAFKRLCQCHDIFLCIVDIYIYVTCSSVSLYSDVWWRYEYDMQCM